MTVVIREVSKTEIYLDEDGDVVILQHMNGGEATCIIFPPEHIDSVVRALNGLRNKNSGQVWDQVCDITTAFGIDAAFDQPDPSRPKKRSL